ncbi:MAG: hypothetical protein ACXVIY_12465 [Mucilaginibacter sp.]
MLSHKIHISCPECGWEPDGGSYWMCSVCKTRWNTFDTRAMCPGCGKIYEETTCPKPKGGCGNISRHEDWYIEVNEVKSKFSFKSILSFGQSNKLPVTPNDKKWVEQSLLFLAELFEPSYFRSLTTVTTDKEYFDNNFTGTEEDAEYVLERLISLMHIDAWEIRLMFYSNKPTSFSEGITATPQDKLRGSWKSSSGKYVDKGLGYKEIWIELEEIKDTASLIATMAHELAHYKLIGEYRMEENDELLTDLTALAFGFGIFMGNSYFKFSQWNGSTHQGWRMRKSGYLPEQVIAYAMAWLAHYRNEDIDWKHYLNKSTRKYFEQSYDFIRQNKDTIKWE